MIVKIEMTTQETDLDNDYYLIYKRGLLKPQQKAFKIGERKTEERSNPMAYK